MITFNTSMLAARLVLMGLGIATTSLARAEDFSTDVSANWRVQAQWYLGNSGTFVDFGIVTGQPGYSGNDIYASSSSLTSASNGMNYYTLRRISTDTTVGPGYAGSLLGNLSASGGITATYRFNTPATDGTLLGSVGVPGPFPRIYFGNAALTNAGTWVYTGGPGLDTFQDNVYRSVAASFSDLAHWKNISGVTAASNPAAFLASLGNVQSIGLLFINSPTGGSGGFEWYGPSNASGRFDLTQFTTKLYDIRHPGVPLPFPPP